MLSGPFNCGAAVSDRGGEASLGGGGVGILRPGRCASFKSCHGCKAAGNSDQLVRGQDCNFLCLVRISTHHVCVTVIAFSDKVPLMRSFDVSVHWLAHLQGDTCLRMDAACSGSIQFRRTFWIVD